MKVSFLTTFFCSDEQRLLNLEKVIRTVCTDFPRWEVIVIEQSEQATLCSQPFVKKINYSHVFNPGPFNKSWGMNVAFKQSSGDILVICDADMLLKKEDLKRAVSACEKELDAVRPYGMLIDMSREETGVCMATGELPSSSEIARGFNRKYISEALCFAGGVYIVRRDYFTRIGGMDERFTGWGGEDDAMSIKLQAMSEKVAVSKKAIAWHLWHARGNRARHDDYDKNRTLLRQYQAIPEEEQLEYFQQQKIIGDATKFQF